MNIKDLTREFSIKWRKEHNIYLKDVAEYCQCHFTLIGKWELSTQNMSYKYLNRYVDFINKVEDGTIKIENRRGRK